MSVLDKVTEKLNNSKLSNMDDDKKKECLRVLYYTVGFVAGVLTTVTVANTTSYYKSFSDNETKTKTKEN